MANCMIGFPDRIDTATLSGGSWAASLPRTNMQNRVLGKVARSVDALLASTQLDMDLGTPKNIRLAAIVSHNCSLSASIRIRASADAGFTTITYDSGWLAVWPVVYATASLEWEDDNWWSGQYTDEQRAGYNATFVHVLPFNAVARYWRIEINDTANVAGYVQIGRVFIGPAWQPIINLGYGEALGWGTKTAVQAALGGTEYFQRRTPYRIQTFKLAWMDTDQALGNSFEIQRRAGIDQEVLWIYDPDDTVHALRRRFIGRLNKLDAIQHPYLNTHSTAFEIKETL